MRNWRKWAIAGITIGIMVVFAGCGKKAINLNDCCEIELKGANGYAEAEVVINDEEILEVLEEKVEISKKTFDDFDYCDPEDFRYLDQDKKEEIKEWIIEDICDYLICYTLDKSKKLSNGDTIILTWDIDDEEKKELEEKLDVKIKYSDIKTKVNGLEDVKKVDLFKDVSVEFSGYDGYGNYHISLNGKEEYLCYINIFFSSSNQTHNGSLKNGEEIVLEAKYSEKDEEYLATEYGIIPEKMTATFAVSGLPLVEKVDLFKDVSVEFSGYDGYGDYHISSNGKEEYLYYIDIFFSSSNQTHSGSLKNGEEIILEADYWAKNEEYFAAEYGIVPEKMTTTFTVSGLTSVEEIDPLAYYDFSVEGISGSGTLKYDLNEEGLSLEDGIVRYFRVDADKTSDIKNGDVISIKITSKDAEALAEKYGKKIAENNYKYTVIGLTEYASSLSDISDEAIKSMKQVFIEYNEWEEDGEAFSPKYIGAYLFSRKYPDSNGIYNTIVMVFKILYTDLNNNESLEYYWAGRFYNLESYSNGRFVVDLENYDVIEGTASWIYSSNSVLWIPWDKDAYILGYETLEELIEDYIVPIEKKYDTSDSYLLE